MENPYYNETVEKDSKQRGEQLVGIQAFLEREKARATARREQFITPIAYRENPEKYREEFVRMLGFPLLEKREMPLVKKNVCCSG